MFKIRERKVVKKLLAVISAMTLSAAALIQSPVNAEAAGFTGNDIAAKAVTYQGVPYVSGGASRSGVDCSGFVYSVLTEMGFGNVPRAQAAWWNVSGLTYQGMPVQIQQLDAANPAYEARPGDILVYQGHVCISMGRPGTWIDNAGNSYGDIRSYVAAIGGNTGLVFETSGSVWPARSAWYRIHARSTAPNAEGRITGVEIDDTNTGATSTAYATVAYRLSVEGSTEPVALQEAAQPSQETVLAAPTPATPQIQSIQVSEQSGNGYRVTVQIDNLQNASQIYFPTWTNTGWQDDITWAQGEINGNTISYYVSANEHGMSNDIYYTHIHIYDQNGNLNIDGVQINGLN